MGTNADYEYIYTDDFEVTDDVIKTFQENGYILLRGVLDTEELGMVLKTIEDSEEFLKHTYGYKENGRMTKRVNWCHPGNDVTGMVDRCEKVAGVCEKLLGGEVYHYHTKLMMKSARTGSQHYWHQDYGYWYHNGCMFPDMMTVFIALDPCKKKNGCLQVLRGSHKCGRIDHVQMGEQKGADMDRVNVIRDKCQHEFIEMNPGDALYFHCNVLHASSNNTSDTRRWAFIASYNKADNNPVIEHHHASYTPLYKVPNESIKSCTNFTDMSGKKFLVPETSSWKLREETEPSTEN